jgi:hypothetical protein
MGALFKHFPIVIAMALGLILPRMLLEHFPPSSA